MPLIQLTYVSIANRPMASSDLLQILESSRRNNPAVDGTGMLLYANHCFIQALEGDERAVLQTYYRIRNDARHGSLLMISPEQISERMFPSWSMGFENLHELNSQELTGFTGILAQPLDESFFRNHPTRAKRLVRAFLEKSKIRQM